MLCFRDPGREGLYILCINNKYVITIDEAKLQLAKKRQELLLNRADLESYATRI